MGGKLSVFSLVVLSAATTEAAPAVRPVVAVFRVEPRGVELSKATLEALDNYLAIQVAALPAFRCVPRDAVHERLRQSKAASYRKCYAQSCQIEIGQELAAAKVVSGQILKVGKRCVLSVALYDLKSATTDRVATAEGSCDESGMAKAIDAAVVKLAPPREPPAAPASVKRQEPLGKRYSLRVTSTPSGADVVVDGRSLGTTPTSIDLPANEAVEVSVIKQHRKLFKRRVTMTGWDKMHADLELSEAGRTEQMTTTEWVAVGAGASYESLSERVGMRSTMRIATLKWRHFALTVVDLGFAFFMGDMSLQEGGSETMFTYDISTRPAYPLYLGARGQHQLWSSLGLGYAGVSIPGLDAESPLEYDVFAVSPGFDYVYLSSGFYTFGVGLRLQLPVAGSFEDYPLQFLAALNFGFNTGAKVSPGSSSVRIHHQPHRPRLQPDGTFR